jgi:hypothetical protein
VKRIIAILGLSACAAFARPGETIEQLTTRYGVRPSIRAGKKGEIWTFKTKSIHVEVQADGFTSAKSSIETYRKPDGQLFTAEEVTAMLKQIDRRIADPITDLDNAVWWELGINSVRADSLAVLEIDRKSFSIGPYHLWRYPKEKDSTVPGI